MVLVQKWPFFQHFFFLQHRPGKCLLRYSRTKKMPFLATKTRSSKRGKIDTFLKGLTHGFVPKIAIFPTIFFQAIQTRKMSFTIFQNEKMPFQAIKTRSSKSRKIDIFLKGLTHGFCPNITIFPTFFVFRQYRPGKCLLRYCRTKKKPFQAIKTRSSQSRKIDIFLKGLTHGFGPKMAIFPTVFFGQYRPGTCLLGYSRRKKKCLFRL